MTDAEAWKLYPEDNWVYNKTIIARLYGVWRSIGSEPIPNDNKYCIKPVTNLKGCSIGAVIVENMAGWTPPEHCAWFEYLEGKHWTVDFVKVDDEWHPINNFIGFKHKHNFRRFDMWERSLEIPEVDFSKVLSEIKQAPIVNFEGISDKVIEVHLRGNTDPVDWDIIIPVWEDDPHSHCLDGNPEYTYIEDTEQHPERVGFYVRKYDGRV